MSLCMKLKPYNKQEGNITPLSEMLPLPTPFSILIDPTNICNFRCSFCPTGNQSLLDEVGRPKGYMDINLYRKIINDISLLCTSSHSRITRIHLYKDGEPLLNKELSSMIAYTKQMNVSDSVETTTNAAALTKSKSDELIDSGLDVIRISVEHVNDQGYKAITKTFGNYDKIVRNVKYFYNEKTRRQTKLHVFVKIIDAGLSDSDKKKFIDDFSEISDSINIDKPMGWSQFFGKSIGLDIIAPVGMDGFTKRKRRVVCPEPFSKLSINFDGTVSICCVDWSHGTVVGDLKKTNITNIWHGAELKEFRLKHLQGKRSEIPACAGCDRIEGFSEITNLDNDTQRLIDLFQKSSQLPNI